MKHNNLALLLTLLFAILIPISLMTLPASIMSLAGYGMVENVSPLVLIFAPAAMLLAGSYTITYALSVVLTYCKKTVWFVALLPSAHVLLTFVFIALWFHFE